jgi:carbon-monoxide dehydrogenase large subunit
MLDEVGRFSPQNHTYPNGCHCCEVEVDPETGAVELLRYTVVHDFGRVLNPMMLAGQVHGGVVQGIGQALFEETVYDAESGQLLSGSLMDYCLPRAADLPAIDFHSIATPCPSNPAGFKGCGEAGAAGAPPALVNAVIDALAPLGVRHIDMPLSPQRVWQAIQHATETKLG